MSKYPGDYFSPLKTAGLPPVYHDNEDDEVFLMTMTFTTNNRINLCGCGLDLVIPFGVCHTLLLPNIDRVPSLEWLVIPSIDFHLNYHGDQGYNKLWISIWYMWEVIES